MRTRNLEIPGLCQVAHPGMTGIKLVRRLPALRRYLKRCKIKTGCDGAAHQRPVAGAFGSLPSLYGDNGLRHFARGEIGTESHAPLPALVANFHSHPVARLVMPAFHP